MLAQRSLALARSVVFARRGMQQAMQQTRAAYASASRPPAQVGDAVDAVDTPALLVDLDAFERNCAKLRAVMAAYPGVNIRPHAKAHKSGAVAQLQLQLLGAAARGVCVQKVCEAEALAAGGITDILLTNEVVAPRKLARLLDIASAGVRLGVCVDHTGPLRALAQMAAARGLEVGVLVDVNVGQDRCGVDGPAAAVQLASLAASLPGVQFRGIQAYHGGLQHVRTPEERAARVGRVAEAAAEAAAAIRGARLACPEITGGGSGSYRVEAGSGVYTEVQPGSFCFGDADYARNLQQDGSLGEWEQALWLATTVMSVSEARALAVTDAGLKAVSTDSGPPVLPPAATGGVPTEWRSGGDEHGILLFPRAGTLPGGLPPPLPALGALLRLQPGHCDPTVNLHDWLVGVRGDTVAEVWRVDARGPGA